MIRKIIKINEELCNGCGLCATACHEGAIDMVDGKAKLMREHYCDGLGDCLPACPAGAISFEEREAPAYDHEAVLASQGKRAGYEAVQENQSQPTGNTGGCPGAMARAIVREPAEGQSLSDERAAEATRTRRQDIRSESFQPSELTQWPVQIKLVPPTAPYFDGAHLLIAADCTAFTYGNFHRDFIRNHVVLIGCPKLDEGDYSEKLTEIISKNNIKSVKIVRMEVPCCGGIEQAAKKAIQNSGKFLPWMVVTVSVEGNIIE